MTASQQTRGGYGDAWAAVYDDLYAGRDDPDLVVRFVSRYADPATVCEFGIGTGRVALPLAAAGFEVHGIDNSAAMLDRLRAKPGAERIHAALGDITDPPVTGRFGCVLIAFSTLYLLTDQRLQRRCVEAAARLLEPTGALIVEGFIPDPTRWHDGYSLSVTRWEEAARSYSIGRIDPAAQVIETVRVNRQADSLDELPNRLRYVLPAELDLLAEHAGLTLVDRFANLAGAALGPNPTDHASVYRRREG
ncbi:class I SAM-dependent methyltransferase [Dactylosporangium roseum]|uniref:Class I SAM-dependent methyltransferase n=1 Tax=Dactylosporangium roseum TaxID=47989 RepID=A0ABY5ZCA0_9ACTN|nr:class I SAM-dependent methyltransferase [Dactylosporangium roseum]UWZ38412.1 class I SAM-dependent methyltransferase [Dactylosporangium roseum]